MRGPLLVGDDKIGRPNNTVAKARAGWARRGTTRSAARSKYRYALENVAIVGVFWSLCTGPTRVD